MYDVIEAIEDSDKTSHVMMSNRFFNSSCCCSPFEEEEEEDSSWRHPSNILFLTVSISECFRTVARTGNVAGVLRRIRWVSERPMPRDEGVTRANAIGGALV